MEKPWVYLDTSVYVKLFVRESGSIKARNIARKSRVLSSAILSIECYSAVSRRARAGEIAGNDVDRLVNEIRDGLLSVETVRVTDEVLQKAEEVVLRSDARTLDAIHIASALLFRDATTISLTLVTSDKKQNEAALREGLKTLFLQ